MERITIKTAMPIPYTLPRRACWILFACFVPLALTGSRVALAADALAWKFEQNKTFNYRLSQQVKMTMVLDSGGNVRVLSNQTLDLFWRVEKVTSAGESRLLLKINHIQWNIDGPGGQGLQYDSAAKHRPQGFAAMLADLLKSLTTETYHVDLSPRGEIVHLEVPNTLLETINDAPGSELMGGLASQEGLQELLQSCWLVLPQNGPLQPGDSWSVATETPNPVLGGKLQRTSTYHYVGPQARTNETLEEFTRQAVTRFEADTNPGATTVQIRDQQSSGKALFLRSAGRLESSTDSQTLTLRMTTGKHSAVQTLEQTVQCQWIP